MGQMDMLPPGAMHGAAQVAGGTSLPTLQLLNLIPRTQETTQTEGFCECTVTLQIMPMSEKTEKGKGSAPDSGTIKKHDN